MQSLKWKFLNAIDSWRLKLEVWVRDWYSYRLNIQKLVWERNLVDGWNIYIFDERDLQLAEVHIDNNIWETHFIEK